MVPLNLTELPQLSALPELSFPGERLLFDEGQACLGYPLLQAGTIKVSKLFPNGRELHLYHLGPGETCVVSAACLFEQMPYSARAVTQGPVQLRMIPPALFEALLGQPVFRRYVMGQFARRLSDLMLLLDAVCMHRLDQRLAARLLAHRAEQGDVVAVTHQQLADELGSVREVISRLIKNFAQQGWIRIERGSICILAPAALQQCAGAAG